MAGRGRPRKPTALKILDGNPGKRPLPTDEPQPQKGAPECPQELSGEALAEWNRIVPELERIGLLSVVDRAALVAYCLAWRELCEATAHIDKHGRTYDCNGLIKSNPAVQMQRDAMNQVRHFLTEFGLSPASRAKLGGAGLVNARPASNLNEFLAKKHG